MIKEFKEYNTTSSTNNLTLILKLNKISHTFHCISKVLTEYNQVNYLHY